MDIKEFYFQNIQESEYHHRFYESIRNVNRVYNIFDGYTVFGIKDKKPSQQNFEGGNTNE